MRLKSDSGQTVVETTLLLPLILLLVMLLVEFGFAFYTNVTINNAASEAARYAAVANLPSTTPGTCDPGSIEERATDFAGGRLLCSEISVSYQNTGGEYTRGDGVAVRINHSYDTITPVPGLVSLVSGGLIPSTWTISACSDSRLEAKPANQSVLVAGADCG
jgi:Flp pilus assembly protein TadG